MALRHPVPECKYSLYNTYIPECKYSMYIFMCVTWLIHMCDKTHSYVWHDSFICVTWLIHMCDTTYSYVWRDSFICMTWLIHMCDTTYSYVWRDSFIRVTWLIHVCDSFICVTLGLPSVCCRTLGICFNIAWHLAFSIPSFTLQHTATLWITLQHTATLCNTLQFTQDLCEFENVS